MATETVHTAADTATDTPAHVTRLVDALSRAVSDRRRVDELVTLFEYDGLVEAAGQRYSGQGAVKRFFSSLLLENGFTALEVLEEPSSQGPDDAALRLGFTSATGTDEVALLLQFRNGLVRECHLQAAEGAAAGRQVRRNVRSTARVWSVRRVVARGRAPPKHRGALVVSGTPFIHAGACSPAGCLLPSALEPSEGTCRLSRAPSWRRLGAVLPRPIWPALLPGRLAALWPCGPPSPGHPAARKALQPVRHGCP